MEKVLAHKNRLTKASASEKVGKALEYQIVCLSVQEKLACKWSAKITTKEKNPSNVGVVRAIDWSWLNYELRIANYFNSPPSPTTAPHLTVQLLTPALFPT